MEEKIIKKGIHLQIDHKVWREYKKFCANLEEHASKRVENFMKKDMGGTSKPNGG